ncbi:MAG: VWA domain-containing protein, partial [Terracidiphilus sp.]
MKFGLTATMLAAVMGSGLSYGVYAAGQQQPAVPDAPTPQGNAPLGDLTNGVKPGMGAGNSNSSTGTAPGQEQPATQPPPSQTAAPSTPLQTTPPELPAPGEGPERIGTVIRTYTTYVEVPVTVKDTKGHLVPGLTWRDFRVFENGVYEPLKVFSVDAMPLSIAFVVDQSLTSDTMNRVNDSLDAIQGALTPYDEIAVFTYSHGSQERTGFTGAQSARVPAVMALTKATGSEEI